MKTIATHDYDGLPDVSALFRFDPQRFRPSGGFSANQIGAIQAVMSRRTFLFIIPHVNFQQSDWSIGRGG